MITTTTGFVERLDFSEKFCNFTNYHHTFGKNTQIYNADVAQNLDFEVVALHRKDDSGTTVTSPIPDTHLTNIMAIVNWLFSEAKSGILTTNEATVNNELVNRFGSATLDVVVDSMVTDEDNNILPNKITLTYIVGDDLYNYEFWFNSLTIDSEYTGSDLIVFGPTDQIDYLINDKATVNQLINERDIDDYNVTLNLASKNNPYTSVVSMATQWVNKDNPAESLSLRFSFICYGPVKDNLSLLRLALRDYVEANTLVSDTIWETVLPEIFTATTFLVIPAWDSISNGVGNSAIYNPILSTKRIGQLYKDNLATYTEEHVDDNFEVLPSMWQSLAMGVVGAPKNKLGYTTISNSLDDYMLVSPGSTDFIRLRANTQDFILKLNNALPTIQSYKANDALPGTLELEIIDGLHFLVFTSYNIKCKVLSREDYLVLIGG